jgi:hypothetical protein
MKRASRASVGVLGVSVSARRCDRVAVIYRPQGGKGGRGRVLFDSARGGIIIRSTALGSTTRIELNNIWMGVCLIGL